MDNEPKSSIEKKAEALREVFGRKIKEAREAQGYSQAVLGKKIGVTKHHVSKLERGKMFARPEKLLALSDLLGIEFNFSACGVFSNNDGLLKKYILIDEGEKTKLGKSLYRIKAVRPIDRYGVNAGDLGGLVDSERNLSHDGDAWIADNAKVLADTWVAGDALVADNALVAHSRVTGNAQITGNAWVFDNSVATDNAAISGNAWVQKSVISGDAIISDEEKLFFTRRSKATCEVQQSHRVPTIPVQRRGYVQS